MAIRPMAPLCADFCSASRTPMARRGGFGSWIGASQRRRFCKRCGRQTKEMAMRRKRLARLLRKLRAMRKSLPKRDQLLLRLGAAKKDAGRAFGFVKIRMPAQDQAVTRDTFSFAVDKAKLKATQQRDGHYLLRSNLTGED